MANTIPGLGLERVDRKSPHNFSSFYIISRAALKIAADGVNKQSGGRRKHDSP
jgi:hypothetical protein